MKQFNRLMFWVILIGLGVITAFSYYTYYDSHSRYNKDYMTEVNRISNQINQGSLLNDIKLEEANYIQRLESIDISAEPLQIELFFNGAGVDSKEGFIIKPFYHNQKVAGYLRFSYILADSRIPTIVIMDIILLLALSAILAMLLYVKIQIINPFHVIEEMPFELSKGHLKQGLKENKSRFFGKFIWGLDLLRESLESQKQTNLHLEKDRQTLVASISHELKTPVSAIKLYSTALYDNLYESETKRKECAKLIEQKADQIERLISDIITTSVSSLRDIEIHMGEFYLSTLIHKINHSNKERLELLKINFEIRPFRDKLLLGDLDKLIVVIDNIIENAIKYGDGNQIKLTFAEEDYRQLVCLENSGIPVSPNELPHIFTSFWRGSNAGTKHGNGLGLYICKQLIQKMDGEIFAETRELGMSFVLVIRY